MSAVIPAVRFGTMIGDAAMGTTVPPPVADPQLAPPTWFRLPEILAVSPTIPQSSVFDEPVSSTPPAWATIAPWNW